MKRDRRWVIAWVATIATSPHLLTQAIAAASLPHVDESDPLAAALGYKNDSSQVDSGKYPQHKQGQLCSACRYFQGKSDDWGPCQIFPNKAVNAKGWCATFAEKS